MDENEPHHHAPARRLVGERGANLVEYILLVTLIALAVIGAVLFLRGQITRTTVKAGVEIGCSTSTTVEEGVTCDVARNLVDNPDVNWANPDA